MDDFQRELIEAQEQRSNAWRDARCGKFTSSEIWKLMTNARSKSSEWSQTALTYINTKVAEEITGHIHESSPAYPLVWGEEQEPIAKQIIQGYFGLPIERAGFVAFTDHAGGTPDGYINDWVLEIKCPYNPANHIEYLMLETAEDLLDFKPENYYQCQSNMLFTKKENCYLISYDGRFPDNKQIKVLELTANVDVHAEMLSRLDKAIETKLNRIKLLQ